MSGTMACPRCQGVSLAMAVTKRGVEVDRCPSCKGIWLDKGEIFYFFKEPKALTAALRAAASDGQPGDLLSPKSGKPMKRIRVFDLELDLCSSTGGIWLDAGELETLSRKEPAIRVDPGAERPATAPSRLAAYAAGLAPLPNLFARCAGALILLYVMLGLLLIAAVEFMGLPDYGALLIAIGIAAIQFFLSPWIMDLTLRWFYQCEWQEPSSLPQDLREFMEKLCREKKMKFPRVGIIDDGGPNAFTYGHHPSNARVVLTRGLFEILEPHELRAVVAHEIGHAAHWDMLIMTVANLVPLIAYYVYRTLIRMRVKGRDKTRAQRMAIAIGAYIVYIVSTYIVLWLSRSRELHADRFAADATGNPSFLASALVKIGYGLAGREPAGRTESRESAAPRERRHGLEAIGALGIFDGNTARTLAIASSQPGRTGFDSAQVKGAMRWEMWNPWAKFFEFQSTHPLIATRLDHLGRQSAQKGLEPFVIFDEKQPESYWDEFLIDLFIMFLPAIFGVPLFIAAAGSGNQSLVFLGFAALGLGLVLKTYFSYGGQMFPEMTVSSLLKHVKVSAVRGIPCSLRGTIIGRGVAGLIWSEDFVMRDETGIIFLDYRQPLRVFEFFFGLLRAGDYENAQVTITGWYRRAPTPYVELRTLTGPGSDRACYTRHMKYALGVIAMALGMFLAMSAAS